MTRTILAASLTILLTGGHVTAHHSWAGFDAEATTFAGEIVSTQIANPHVLVELRGTDGRSYTLVWSGLGQLARAGLSSGVLSHMLRTGDRLTVTGRLKQTETTIEVLPQQVAHAVHGVMWPPRRS